MTDRPIIFSAPMVRALLEGRKTQTRRLAWRRATKVPVVVDGSLGNGYLPADDGGILLPTPWRCVRPGDRLYVRENLRLGATSAAWCYAADDRLISLDYPDHRVAQMIGWAHHQERESVPSIHMPRWASRITLTLTDVRRQRLQEITDADAQAEGATQKDTGLNQWRQPNDSWSMHWPANEPTRGWRDVALSTPRFAFGSLWNEFHGAGWDTNPEVVAITFTVAQRNIDKNEEEAA